MKKTKPAKAKRIEAVRAWGSRRLGGKLLGTAYLKREYCVFPEWAVPVRIIRESDYRRLLAAAKRKGVGR